MSILTSNIIIDFGNSLKSVLTSLVYTDVNQKNVLFTTEINGLTKVYFMKILFKQFIILLLIIFSLKNIIKIILNNSKVTQMK